jgi:ribonuclease H / adenosylcobalamin/alpha-ribazole phosphatase
MRYELYFDGSCLVNPGGPAGWGFHITDHNWQPITEDTGFIPADGVVSCNVAEWQGLLNGVRAFIALEVRTEHDRLAVYGDSKLVINQASEKWKCKKEHLKALKAELVAILKDAGIEKRISYHWIPRERNAYADQLSNYSYQFAGLS